MNIGMLLNAPYPSDVRVKKEATALLKAGFGVYLLCLRQKNQPVQDEADGIKITRIDGGTNNYELAFWDVVMSGTFKHPKFKNAIPSWVKLNNITALHVHDLPLAGTALALREKLNIPVVADFHENYPEALKTWFEWKKNPLARLKNKLFLNPAKWVLHERKAVHDCDRIIAVVDEMKNRLIRDHNADQEKISVITNSEGLDFLQQPDDADIYAAYSGKFIITYSGNIGPHRGVDTAIEAMQYLKSQPDIVLVIVGSGSSPIMDFLKKRVEALGVSKNVYFLGRQPFQKFYSFMKYADANIIPHKSNGHTDNTIPHKLFQAMMVGKPVIVSTSDPLKRIISSTGAGVVFQAGDANDLAEKILKLYSNNPERQSIGQKGIEATIRGKMNWEEDQKKLIALYQNLLVPTYTRG